jgi:hypothetical protein
MNQSYVLPANTNPSGRDSVERKRRLAEAMLAQGMQAEPIRSPWQGAAKIAQAMLGGYQVRKADEQESEGRKSAMEAFNAAVNGGGMPQITGAMGNEYLGDGQQRVLAALLQDNLQRNRPPDPMDAMKLERERLELEALKKPQPDDIVSVGDGVLYNKTTKEYIRPDASGGPLPPFSGTSVEAQSLNGLVQAGKLTQEQAFQIGAGKTVTDPVTGAMLFLTPSGIASQMPGQQPEIVAPAPGGPPIAQEPLPGAPMAPTAPNAAPAMPAPMPEPMPAPMPPVQPPMPQSGAIEIRPGNKPQFNEGQAKAAGFSDRIANALPLIEQFSDSSTLKNKVVSAAPYGLGNFGVDSEFQQLDQARRDFVNAVLRRESGAVISEEEFDNANKQYFPQPGDNPEVIAQKKANRETVFQAMQRDAGAAYKPKANEIDPEIDSLLKKYGAQ